MDFLFRYVMPYIEGQFFISPPVIRANHLVRPTPPSSPTQQTLIPFDINVNTSTKRSNKPVLQCT